ncbi:dipeptide epimerase [Fodinibius sp. Rm-B-1B1-1]|uniref:dipeptide epimerase n=1 Tax=Fodinibius alkaliphilus TaxID=3140241 RepID=UPI00315AFC2A
MSHFELDYELLNLTPAHPFTIARGTKETVPNVLVKLTANGITGFGEAGPNKRYNETAETVTSFLDNLSDSIFDDVDTARELSEQLNEVDPTVQSAKTAVEMAWLDWWGKSQKQPLWKLWDTPSRETPPTSFTIGLDEIDVIQQKVLEAEEYPILKIKLGTDRDKEIINGIREVSDQIIRVDANEGWTNLETAKEQIRFLAGQNVEFIEQPMPSAMHDKMVELKKWSPLPLIADESFKGDENMDEIEKAFDGINIKLMKMGSLVKARSVIEKARNRNLQVMIGCMIESSLGIAAGSLLGTWADYVDLDGNLLLAEDPFEGLTLTENKEVRLSDKAGLGVIPKS